MSAFQISWVEEFLGRKPAIIFDCGCYDGADAIRFKEEWPDSRAIAIEACPDNFSFLERMGLAEAAGVEIYHYAVCDHYQGAQFHSNVDTNQPAHFGQSGSILVPTAKIRATWPSISYKAPRKVPTVRLDGLCQQLGIQGIDLLHMDVQGAERPALDGLGELRPKMIFLETDVIAENDYYYASTSESELHGWFGKNGYDKKWQSPYDTLYVRTR